MDTIFGKMKFDYGWESPYDFELFGKKYKILLRAEADNETDAISDKQEQSFEIYQTKKATYSKLTQILLETSIDDFEAANYKPTTLLFQQNGEFTILLDDRQNEDDGIAVVLFPNAYVTTQDYYL